jgi:hypothetical protein
VGDTCKQRGRVSKLPCGGDVFKQGMCKAHYVDFTVALKEAVLQAAEEWRDAASMGPALRLSMAIDALREAGK